LRTISKPLARAKAQPPTIAFFLISKDLASLKWQELGWGKRVNKTLDSSNVMLRAARFGLPRHPDAAGRVRRVLYHEIYAVVLFRKRH
jgi:hypothetical protein